MISHVLVAVDDSTASLAAARFAAALAAALGARLRVVHVAVDHELDEALRTASERPQVATRLEQGQLALLTRVRALAAACGAEAEAELLTGQVASALLADACQWEADVVVVGRSDRVTGDPYVGSHTRHVLEFAELPVLVVPPPAARTR